MKPHHFVGRSDRWCEVCDRPDRDPIHLPESDWELVEGPLSVTIPPRTAAVKTCTTHHACPCHERLAQIGRNYLENIEFQP